MKKNTKRTVFAALAVLAAGASVAGGATVTASAIDNPDPGPTDSGVVVQQVAQDAKGDWYACTVDLHSANVTWDTTVDSGAISVTVGASGQAPDGDAGTAILVDSAAGQVPQAVTGLNGETLDTMFGVAVASGQASVEPSATGTAVELPTPDQIRSGTPEECAALTGK